MLSDGTELIFLPQVVLAIGITSAVLFHLLVPNEDHDGSFPSPPVAAPPGEEQLFNNDDGEVQVPSNSGDRCC